VVLVSLSTIAWGFGIVDQARRGKDDWPLSAFAMYCDRASPVAIRDRMFGVSDADVFPLTEKHTNPVAGTRLNFMLRKMRGPSGRAGLAKIRQLYEDRRAEGFHDDPPLSAVRAVRESWRTNRELKGMDKPSISLRLAVFLPPDPLVRALEAESRGELGLLSPHTVDRADVVVEADSGQIVGTALRIDDANASGKSAVRFPEHGVERIPSALGSGVRIPFQAAAGTYFVWLRLKKERAGDQASVYLGVDGFGAGQMAARRDGVGHVPEEYPERAFAWVSMGGALEAATVVVPSGEKHELFIAPREGPVVLDQVWLARTRHESPLFHEPVTQ
jgi:hypothetical protein